MSAAAEVFARLRAGDARRRTEFTVPRRRAVLRRLAAEIRAREAEIMAALASDLGKPAVEVRISEIIPILSEIRHTSRHLKSWAGVRRVRPTLSMLGTRATIRPEPKGTVLILAPWNYPLCLALGPLVSAIAAGNAAVVKPSELAPATSALIAKLVAACLPEDLVTVVEGGVETATELLALPFDHIFFTGSPAVGKVVMAAAAKTLASVTLELGGKSPVILGPDADLKKAARMVAWGKFQNAGQTCIAPDHVFVPRAQEEAFTRALRAEIVRMYGARPQASRSFARLIGAKHFERLRGMVTEAVGHGATLIAGGEAEAASRYLAPTVLANVPENAALMREEIFGPVLPVIAYDDLDAVLAGIEAGEKPLALYVFARDRRRISRICAATTSGAVGVNVTLAHFLHLNLPFGGIGQSGLGAAHGHWGFAAFSHEKPVLENRFAVLEPLMPPYGKLATRLARIVQALVG
ncbi:aldehyde dehydrogenase family protein [Rhodobacter capsulatus]|uniref:aldehyde dehydrogenase family protein n=1 Tax=Rhodobacter capsulatus TaxID=1061 RepID=UPI0006DC243E|nr:aldehyde dehydrogenase family protein [Rhodobacter capsulatus]KQB15652.1 aldehyde dehydrogenase [Rhodobacter capsulatus]KQB16411.1 aldehyde dehydrogenase [Rhodobacter capsulatus]PZX22566.1 aldehyde dehydrogenase (NAD+) [Rhodobacter capsulatus]QNR64709.1 aldehyde dehydrogenase family protein [Rhodobacter capsulatus]